MRLLTLSLVAWGAAIGLSLSPVSPARAQDTSPPMAPRAVPPHGDWPLREREECLGDPRHEDSRLRDGDGELTDNQTADLEQRLDTLADKIHPANMNTYTRPW